MQTKNMSYPGDVRSSHESADWANQYRQDVRRVVNENPSGVVLSAFGVGLGVGLAIGMSLAMSSAPPRRVSVRNRAEDLGQRILDSIQDYVPDSVARHLS